MRRFDTMDARPHSVSSLPRLGLRHEAEALELIVRALLSPCAHARYVLVDHDGRSALAWQGGSNSVLAIGDQDEQGVEVQDNWWVLSGRRLVRMQAAPGAGARCAMRI